MAKSYRLGGIRRRRMLRSEYKLKKQFFTEILELLKDFLNSQSVIVPDLNLEPEEKQAINKKWIFRLVTDRKSQSLVAYDCKEEDLICYFLTRSLAGNFSPVNGAEQCLSEEGYDPYLYNCKYTESGALFIDYENNKNT